MPFLPPLRVEWKGWTEWDRDGWMDEGMDAVKCAAAKKDGGKV